MANWEPITYETLPWDRSSDELSLIPKSARRKITATYQAAIPLEIRDKEVTLPPELSARKNDLLVSLARFDAQQRGKGYNLPALLLRSESSASSQIENFTSSARNIALAEITEAAPHNAKLIAGNIAAMKEALSLNSGVNTASIEAIHAALINHEGVTFGGKLREEQVWVGGTSYSPHGALFVPPAAKRIGAALDDLAEFTTRTDIDPVVKAAIAHAQFETIHPFIDGNGRTGRTLLHKILKDEEVLIGSTLPVSAGLLNNVDAYLGSLNAYHEGNYEQVVEQVINALELAVSIGLRASKMIDKILDEWGSVISERSDSRIWQLPSLLVEQPVVNSAYLAEHLEVSARAATGIISRACQYGILRPVGNKQRGDCFQSDDILTVLDEISSTAGIRRMLAAK